MWLTFSRKKPLLRKIHFVAKIKHDNAPLRLIPGCRFRVTLDMGKQKGATAIDTPLKAKISRDFQSRGGESVRGAAAATARAFNITSSDGAARVKKYDRQIRDGCARRNYRRSGRRKIYGESVGAAIEAAFQENETMTFRELGAEVGVPTTSVYRFSTKDMGYTCKGHTVRPIASEANRAKRVEMGKEIVAVVGPVKNEFHQDEKYFIVNSHRRKRKVKKSDEDGTKKVFYAPHRRHQKQVMFTGCAGVGPQGQPMKIHFDWISKPKQAKRKSKNHERGDIYLESSTMDADYFRKVLCEIGKAIRAEYKDLGEEDVRVKLQIDSAGGHGIARGHGNFEKLKAMMLEDYNVELTQQPGNTPMYNILDLNLWQACQLEVDKMNKQTADSEIELVGLCREAWAALPVIKILRAFEMRKDCAQEAIDTAGFCPNEGKGGEGASRVHKDAAYAELLAHFEIQDS